MPFPMAYQKRQVVLDEHAVTLAGTALGPQGIEALGSTVVVAPHPDDETSACGGLIALLRDRKQHVGVVVVTDGGIAREQEELAALGVLGIAPADLNFLRYGEGKLASQAAGDFDGVVNGLRDVIAGHEPRTVIMPFRADGHADHCATWYLARNASRRLPARPRCLEYPLTMGPATQAVLQLQRPAVWKVDISTVLPRKQRAIAAYRSQNGARVLGDPNDVRFSPRLLENTLRGYEGYFEFPEP
jgi:LmbE family N-acetylglucosaminyl deacetylase